MDCKLLHNKVMIQEKLYEGTDEKPIDFDFTLPDYCPDIEKILKCQILPMITAKNTTGDRLEIEGDVCIKVFYLDATSKALRLCEKSLPFSSSAALKREAYSPVIVAKAKPEYINCRAVSQRRLDIHGAFSINSCVYDNGSYEYVNAVDEDTIEERSSEFDASELICGISHQFTVGSTLEIGASKPPIENILRVGSSVSIDDFKVVSQSAIIKGNLNLSILYSAGIDDITTEKVEYEIPFSETVACENDDNDFVSSIHAEICDIQVEVKPDSDGENNIISFEARVQSEMFLYKDCTVEAVTDAYSKEYETKIEMNTDVLRHILNYVSDTFTEKSEINTADPDIQNIIDIFTENPSVRFEIENGIVKGTGKYNVCIIWKSKEGKIMYAERTQELAITKEIRNPKDGMKCSGDIDIKNVDYKIMQGGDLEIKTDISYNILLYKDNTIKAVKSVFEDETTKRKRKNDDAVCVYFAEDGEDLWSIARNHCTSSKLIKSENGIKEDVLNEGRMIIIPM